MQCWTKVLKWCIVGKETILIVERQQDEFEGIRVYLEVIYNITSMKWSYRNIHISLSCAIIDKPLCKCYCMTTYNINWNTFINKLWHLYIINVRPNFLPIISFSRPYEKQKLNACVNPYQKCSNAWITLSGTKFIQ